MDLILFVAQLRVRVYHEPHLTLFHSGAWPDEIRKSTFASIEYQELNNFNFLTLWNPAQGHVF